MKFLRELKSQTFNVEEYIKIERKILKLTLNETFEVEEEMLVI